MNAQVPKLFSSLPANMPLFESDRAAHAVISADFVSAETKVTTNQAKRKKKKRKNKTTEQIDEATNADQRNPMPRVPSDMTENCGSKLKGPFIINSNTTGPNRRQSISKQRKGSKEVNDSRKERRDETVTEPASTS